MRLRWSANALADLRAIHAYISQEQSAAANDLIDRITRRSAQIVQFPHSGRVVPEYDVDAVREVVETPYRIIYRIGTDQIDILTVMHGAQLLRELDE